MSDTYKTAPWWVRVAARPGVTCVDVHDHRDGTCDLPAVGGAPTRSRCRWEPTPLALFGPGHGCGCAMCTESVWRRQERRRDRHRAHAWARAQARGAWRDDVE